MAKFDNAKVGDRVFSIQYGLGIIDRFVTVNDHKVFKVDFDNGDYEWYFKDGRVNIDDVNPTLFWNEIDLPSEDEDSPLDLVEYLGCCASCIDFIDGEENYFIYYDELNKCFRYTFSIHENNITTVYLDSGNFDFLVDMLNDYRITPQQLRNAYRELGWV